MTPQDRDLLAALVDSSDDAIIGMTLEGVITSWNGASERLYGYTADEAVGRPIAILLPPDGTNESAGTLARIVAGERVHHYRADHVRKDGQRMRVSLSVAPVCDPEGRIVGAATIAHAPTDRENLHARERIAMSQRIAQLGSWDWDVASGVVTWSDELYALYGVDPRTFKPSFETFLECVHPDDRTPVSTEVAAALEQRRGFSMDHRIRRPDGSVRTMAARGEVALGDDGSVARMHGTSQDVTEAHALQNELRRQQETLELVSRATSDMVWEWDVITGRVTRSHAIEAYGYSIEEVEQHHAWWASRVHPDDAPGVEASMAAFLLGDVQTWSGQYRLRRKDGTYATVMDRGYVLRDEAGRPVRMVGSVLDLSERERAQELARRGVASSELLSRASHELRTPLNAILGFSDLLEQRLDASLGSRERRYIQNIRGSGQHLLQLVDRLLQIAKADSGRLELQPSVVALFGLVAPVYAEFAAPAAAAQVALDLDLADASVRVDLDRMSSVLRELVENALAATPAGGSVIVRATIPHDDLVLEVIDTGRGIPAEARDRIFEVFQRVHEDADPSRTGLGLALCRELVELHGGTITFESEPGRGTTFRVHVPHVAWQRETGDRVLIVDDEPNDADLAMTVARDAGLRCELVGTVSDARAAIIRDRPNAIVLDLRLPDGTGNEVLEALRSLGPSIPVLVLSAYDDEIVSPDGTLRLQKPIDPAALATWLLDVTRPKTAA